MVNFKLVSLVLLLISMSYEVFAVDSGNYQLSRLDYINKSLYTEVIFSDNDLVNLNEDNITMWDDGSVVVDLTSNHWINYSLCTGYLINNMTFEVYTFSASTENITFSLYGYNYTSSSYQLIGNKNNSYSGANRVCSELSIDFKNSNEFYNKGCMDILVKLDIVDFAPGSHTPYPLDNVACGGKNMNWSGRSIGVHSLYAYTDYFQGDNLTGTHIIDLNSIGYNKKETMVQDNHFSQFDFDKLIRANVPISKTTALNITSTISYNFSIDNTRLNLTDIENGTLSIYFLKQSDTWYNLTLKVYDNATSSYVLLSNVSLPNASIGVICYSENLSFIITDDMINDGKINLSFEMETRDINPTIGSGAPLSGMCGGNNITEPGTKQYAFHAFHLWLNRKPTTVTSPNDILDFTCKNSTQINWTDNGIDPDGDSIYYKVKVGSTIGGNDYGIASTKDAAINDKATATSLDLVQMYYWEVQTCDYLDYCVDYNNSDYDSFNRTNCAPRVPTALNPANKSSSLLPITFTWTTGYDTEDDEDTRFDAYKDYFCIGLNSVDPCINANSSVELITTDINSVVLSSSVLSDNRTYYWAVRTDDRYLNSSWVIYNITTLITEFNVLLASEVTEIVFYPDDATSKEVEPECQTNTSGCIIIQNLKNYTINISININDTWPVNYREGDTNWDFNHNSTEGNDTLWTAISSSVLTLKNISTNNWILNITY